MRIPQKYSRGQKAWEEKQQVLALDGVSAYIEEKNNKKRYYFDIKENYVKDWEELSNLIKPTIYDEDYQRYFEAQTVDWYLQSLQAKLPISSLEQEFVLIGDICYLTYYPGDKVRMELTSSVTGENRISCVLSKQLKEWNNLQPNIHVRALGALQFDLDHAQFLFFIKDLVVLPEKTKLYDYFAGERLKYKEYKKSDFLPKRMLDIHSIAVLYDRDKVWKSFQSAFSDNYDLLKFKPMRRSFKDDALAFILKELDENNRIDAIAIIHGPYHDDYAMSYLASANLINAIIDCKKPIFTGLGDVFNNPKCNDYVDYSAPTLQNLAISLSLMKLQVIEETKQPKLEVKEKKEKQGFFHWLGSIFK